MNDNQVAVARAYMTKHGHAARHTKSREYSSWLSMLQRCRNPNSPKAPRYSERGIAVCDRWLVFENFLIDMGARPLGKTLDRWPDNDGPYAPGNCRWATPKEQQTNRRIDHTLESDARKRSWVARRQKYGSSGRAK